MYFWIMKMRFDWKKIIINTKTKLSLISRFYQPSVLLSALAIYLATYFFPIKFIPDYLHLAEVENSRTFIWSLFTVTLGFSGVMLTLLLLSYNFYIKSTRRKTFEFILENAYFKILFSGFISILLLHLLGYAMMHQANRLDKLAVLYLLFILTVSYIILQLPMAIFGIQYSTSIDKIQKIIKVIDAEDIQYITNTDSFLKKHAFEEIEGNRIAILKDLGINAIKDGDWVLPQAILAGIYQLIPDSISKDCPVAIPHQAFKTFFWLSNHFRRFAIRNSDHIMVNVLYSYHLKAYKWLAERGLKDEGFLSHLDKQYKEFVFTIIQSKDYPELRDHIVRDYVEAIMAGLEVLKYTDDELPTTEYHFATRGVKSFDSPYRQYWHYITAYQLGNLVEMITYALQQKDERFYDHYHFQLWNFYSSVEASGLTEFQKISLLKDLNFKTSKLVELAIEQNLLNLIDIRSHVHVEIWVEKGWKQLYWPALHDMASVIRKLIKSGKPYTIPLDDFFMVGRAVSNRDIDVKNKKELLSYLLENGLRWLGSCGENKQLKYDLQHQLDWLFKSFVVEKEELRELADQFRQKITDAVVGYNYWEYPDYMSY